MRATTFTVQLQTSKAKLGYRNPVPNQDVKKTNHHDQLRFSFCRAQMVSLIVLKFPRSFEPRLIFPNLGQTSLLTTKTTF